MKINELLYVILVLLNFVAAFVLFLSGYETRFEVDMQAIGMLLIVNTIFWCVDLVMSVLKEG